MSSPELSRGASVHSLGTFVNEPYSNFGDPVLAQGMQLGLQTVRREFGREYPLIIGGQPRRAAEQFSSHNPSHWSEVVGIHQEATARDAADAVEAAYRHFPIWSERKPEDRITLTLRLADLLRERKAEFNAWLIAESGKSWTEAEADVSEAIDFCEYYARGAARLAYPDPLVQIPGEHDELVYAPLGVGAIIPPWNFPLAIVCGMTIAALVTGNTVVLKPSSETPTIAAKFVELLHEAGFPPECCAFLTGSGVEIGQALVAHPLVRFISFTGSKAVGLEISQRAAALAEGQRWIKRVVAEMGGKDAIIVDPECDLDNAVLGVLQSAFGFQGQKCSACSRVIVDAAIYDVFVDKLKAGAEALTIGPAEDPANFMGPVISPRARKKILDYIDVGGGEGERITGGDLIDPEGLYLRPAIFTGVAPTARIAQEEIFGPVLSVIRSRNFAESIHIANESEYGLTGSVYTYNRGKIELAKKHFFVGNLYINRKCTGAMVGAHPFGGFNMSGTNAKAGGPDYLLNFVQAKAIAERRV